MRLREQQDREYRESQEADRQEQLRREEERRQREEAEDAQRQAEEEREAIELSNRLTKEARVGRLRAYFAAHPEPAEGSSADVSTVRFQLPQGAKLSRRFVRTDTSQVYCFTLHDVVLINIVYVTCDLHTLLFSAGHYGLSVAAFCRD